MNSLIKSIYIFVLVILLIVVVQFSAAAQNMVVDSAVSAPEKKVKEAKNSGLLLKIDALTNEINILKKSSTDTGLKVDKLSELVASLKSPQSVNSDVTCWYLPDSNLAANPVNFDKGIKICAWPKDYVDKLDGYIKNGFAILIFANVILIFFIYFMFSRKVNKKIDSSFSILIDRKLIKIKLTIIDEIKKGISVITAFNGKVGKDVINEIKFSNDSIEKIGVNIYDMASKIDRSISGNSHETDLKNVASTNGSSSVINDSNVNKIESLLINIFNNNSWDVFISKLSEHGFSYECAIKTDSLSRQAATWRIQKSDLMTNILVWYKENSQFAYLISKRDNDKKVELSSLYGDIEFENNHKYSRLAMFSQAKDSYGNTVYKWVNDGELILGT